MGLQFYVRNCKPFLASKIVRPKVAILSLSYDAMASICDCGLVHVHTLFRFDVPLLPAIQASSHVLQDEIHDVLSGCRYRLQRDAYPLEFLNDGKADTAWIGKVGKDDTTVTVELATEYEVCDMEMFKRRTRNLNMGFPGYTNKTLPEQKRYQKNL